MSQNPFQRDIAGTVRQILSNLASTYYGKRNWVTTSRMQKVNGQGHTSPTLNVEAWRRHRFWPLWFE